MEERIISANYRPLQPPYKIIKHGNKIGVWIGTHVITISKVNPFKIETHNYPVVAAEDRFDLLQSDKAAFDGSNDGEVWDNVESKWVSVLCEVGAQLTWQDFIKILWRDHARFSKLSQKIQKNLIYDKLIKYNKSMYLPSPGMHTIHLRTKGTDGKPEVVCSSESDTFALNVEWTDNPSGLEQRLVDDLCDYLLILAPNRSPRLWKMIYETEEERLRPLVDRLNANPTATGFRNRVMASFTLHAIIPYGEDEIQPEQPSPPQEVHGENYYGKDVEVFNDSLNPKKIAEKIIAINRNGIADRHFFLILYEVFNSLPGCLSNNKKSHFVNWMKFNCKIYFESPDLKKVDLSEDEKKKIEEYKGLFADKQINGRWIFNKTFYKTDSMGNPLKSIEKI